MERISVTPQEADDFFHKYLKPAISELFRQAAAAHAWPEDLRREFTRNKP